MKKLIYIFILLISFSSFGQYSNYYGTYDINANVNVNVSVNVTGNVNKTITTIDYGALRQANAMNVRTELISKEEAEKIEPNIHTYKKALL